MWDKVENVREGDVVSNLAAAGPTDVATFDVLESRPLTAAGLWSLLLRPSGRPDVKVVTPRGSTVYVIERGEAS